MDTRREPRFQVQSAVKIATVDQPGKVRTALLLDVSGSGMKIIADRAWPVDSCLVVEMESHLVLARICHSSPRGTKFSLGAERIYSVLKLMLPLDASRAEWHKILLAEAGQTPAPELKPQAAAAQRPESAEFLNEPGPQSSARGSLDEPPQKLQPVDSRTVDLQTVALLMQDLQKLDQDTPKSETQAQHAPNQRIAEVAVPPQVPPYASQPEIDSVYTTVLTEPPIAGPDHVAAPVPSATEQALNEVVEEIARKTAHEAETGRIFDGDRDPPIASALPLLSAASQSSRVQVSAPLARQFGPVYGLAPTCDELIPISMMPEVVNHPKATPRWMVSFVSFRQACVTMVEHA